MIKFRVQEDFNNLSGETTGQPERTARLRPGDLPPPSCRRAVPSEVSPAGLPGAHPPIFRPHSYDFKASEEYVAYAYLDARATPMVTLRQYSYSTATTPASTEYSGLEELYYPYTDHFHHGGGKASPRLLAGTAPVFPQRLSHRSHQ